MLWCKELVWWDRPGEALVVLTIMQKWGEIFQQIKWDCAYSFNNWMHKEFQYRSLLQDGNYRYVNGVQVERRCSHFQNEDTRIYKLNISFQVMLFMPCPLKICGCGCGCVCLPLCMNAWYVHSMCVCDDWWVNVMHMQVCMYMKMCQKDRREQRDGGI